MALKCRGPGSPLNFGLEEYEELLPMLPNLSKVWPSQCQLSDGHVWRCYNGYVSVSCVHRKACLCVGPAAGLWSSCSCCSMAASAWRLQIVSLH